MCTTEKTIRHPIFARMWRRIAPQGEARGQGEHRRELLEGLNGRVVELGAGLGTNFGYYPDAVTELVAIEPEVNLIDDARLAADEASVEVEVVAAVAEKLPLEDASCDAGVACLVLCSVADPEQALAELWRVIRPGGELRFYEHVVAKKPIAAAAMRALDKVYPYFSGNDHMARDTGAAIERAGFKIETCRRFPFAPAPWMPPPPHILGVARRVDHENGAEG
ncbi:MAG: class I SAM-dependent methyltransferase [Actinomycetota bacterium]|nr:class I SAM-dependent methyltransferase [Actinomycetota bacterium]